MHCLVRVGKPTLYRPYWRKVQARAWGDTQALLTEHYLSAGALTTTVTAVVAWMLHYEFFEDTTMSAGLEALAAISAGCLVSAVGAFLYYYNAAPAVMHAELEAELQRYKPVRVPPLANLSERARKMLGSVDPFGRFHIVDSMTIGRVRHVMTDGGVRFGIFPPGHEHRARLYLEELRRLLTLGVVEQERDDLFVLTKGGRALARECVAAEFEKCITQSRRLSDEEFAVLAHLVEHDSVGPPEELARECPETSWTDEMVVKTAENLAPLFAWRSDTEGHWVFRCTPLGARYVRYRRTIDALSEQ